MFFSEYGYRPHVAGVFRHRKRRRKRRFLNTLSRVKTFENGDLSHSCSRAKTEVFKYDDTCLGSRLALWHNYDSKDADLFKYGEKYPFSKTLGYVWTEPKAPEQCFIFCSNIKSLRFNIVYLDILFNLIS